MLGARDSHFTDGEETHYKLWPDTIDGQIDDNGTLRDMEPDEVAELTSELDQADRSADRAAIRDDLELVKTERDQARDTRIQMVGDSEGNGQRPRWSRDITVAGTGNTVRLEQRADHLTTEVAKLNGAVRVLCAVLARVIRAQRLDEG